MINFSNLSISTNPSQGSQQPNSTGELQLGPAQFHVYRDTNPVDVPEIAGGFRPEQRDAIIAGSHVLLAKQERDYGNGEQPPVAVTQLPYDGPPLRFVLGDRPVKFCSSREDALHHYSTVPARRYWPVPEYAARLEGPAGTGFVRARINDTGHAPSAIVAPLADRLGLQRRPLRGPGAVPNFMLNGRSTPSEVLNDPLTVQLLSAPGTVAFQITLNTVVVLPHHNPEPESTMFELQLGLFDFLDVVEFNPLPLWASQFKYKQTGYSFALPVVAPRPPHIYRHLMGSSTFHIAQESFDEVSELAVARQAVLARRQAAAAASAGNTDAQSPADAAAEAMQQASRVAAETAPAPAPAPTPAPAAAATGPAAGTQQWIDEWAPATTPSRPQQQQQRGGRGGRRGRGRGSSRQRTSCNSDNVHGAAAAAVSDAASDDAGGVDEEAADAAALAAGVAASAADLFAGLDPLPAGLVECTWQQVAATSLPEDEDICTICTDPFTDRLENGGERLVTQLHCRHTYCVLCLRQFRTNRSFRRQPLQCPQCRADV